MKPLKEKVSITLDCNIVKEIKEMAEKDDRSFSQFINLILKDYIAKNKLPHRDKKIGVRFCFYLVRGYLYAPGTTHGSSPTRIHFTLNTQS